MSAAARRRIGEAMRKRWAERKKKAAAWTAIFLPSLRPLMALFWWSQRVNISLSHCFFVDRHGFLFPPGVEVAANVLLQRSVNSWPSELITNHGSG